jgi:hypothetical protein
MLLESPRELITQASSSPPKRNLQNQTSKRPIMLLESLPQIIKIHQEPYFIPIEFKSLQGAFISHSLRLFHNKLQHVLILTQLVENCCEDCKYVLNIADGLFPQRWSNQPIVEDVISERPAAIRLSFRLGLTPGCVVFQVHNS